MKKFKTTVQLRNLTSKHRLKESWLDCGHIRQAQVGSETSFTPNSMASF